MGYPDELLESLITYLKAHPPTSGDGAKGAAAAAAKGGGGGDDEEEGEGDGSAEVALVHRILALRSVRQFGSWRAYIGATKSMTSQPNLHTRTHHRNNTARRRSGAPS